MTHLYGEPFHRRLRELGVEAVAFREGAYFGARSNQILSLSARAQRKYRLGPSVDRLNSDLVKAARSLAVHAVFVFHGDLTYPATLRHLTEQGVYTICWQNDDPFGRHPWYVFRHFKRAIPHYDRLFAYRHKNVSQFRARGCRRVELLRSFYIRELNYPVRPPPNSAGYFF